MVNSKTNAITKVDLNTSNSSKSNLNNSQNNNKNQVLNTSSQKTSNFNSASSSTFNSSNRPQSTSTLLENKKAPWKLLQGSDDDV